MKELNASLVSKRHKLRRRRRGCGPAARTWAHVQDQPSAPCDLLMRDPGAVDRLAVELRALDMEVHRRGPRRFDNEAATMFEMDGASGEHRRADVIERLPGV